jgi:hypothetical protein
MKTVCMAGVAVCLCASAAIAEQPHRTWLKYLSGSWVYDGGGAGGGAIDWNLVAGGNALIGTGKNDKGIEDAWAYGWDVNAQAIVSQWFTADDRQAQVSYKIVDDKTIRGPAVVTEASGITKGTVTVRKVSDNEYTVHWTDMTVNGSKVEDVKLVVKRK